MLKAGETRYNRSVFPIDYIEGSLDSRKYIKSLKLQHKSVYYQILLHIDSKINIKHSYNGEKNQQFLNIRLIMQTYCFQYKNSM